MNFLHNGASDWQLVQDAAIFVEFRSANGGLVDKQLQAFYEQAEREHAYLDMSFRFLSLARA